MTLCIPTSMPHACTLHICVEHKNYAGIVDHQEGVFMCALSQVVMLVGCFALTMYNAICTCTHIFSTDAAGFMHCTLTICSFGSALITTTKIKLAFLAGRGRERNIRGSNVLKTWRERNGGWEKTVAEKVGNGYRRQKQGHFDFGLDS